MAVTTVYNTPITGQVGAFAPITLFSVGAEGNFRASLYVWAAAFGAQNKDIIVNVSWTDPSGTSQSFSVGLFTANVNTNAVTGDRTFRAAASTNIMLTSGVDTNDVTDSYNVYPNLEQL